MPMECSSRGRYVDPVVATGTIVVVAPAAAALHPRIDPDSEMMGHHKQKMGRIGDLRKASELELGRLSKLAVGFAKEVLAASFDRKDYVRPEDNIAGSLAGVLDRLRPFQHM